MPSDGGNPTPGTGAPGDNDGNPAPDTGAPVLTPSAATALGMFNATPSVWYGELTTLRTRLGDTRLGEQEGGAWVRAIGGQLKMHDANGEGYSQNQSGISVGVDNAMDIGDNSKMLLGVFSGYSRSDLDLRVTARAPSTAPLWAAIQLSYCKTAGSSIT